MTRDSVPTSDLPPVPTSADSDLARFELADVLGGRVVADRLPATGRPQPDHVIGPGGASATLSGLTPRTPVRRALDLGCGCGIQAIGLAGHAAEVVATDVNPRAVALTRLSAELSGVTVDARAGSWFEPVAGERFDLIVANPPFVIADPADARYRNAGLPGDEATWTAAVGAAGHLARGGIAVLLGSWLLTAAEDWRERVLRRLAGTGCDLRVVQRQRLTVEEYVAAWLSDGARLADAERATAMTQWRAALRDLGAEGVATGWLLLRRHDRESSVRRLTDQPGPVQWPLGEEVADWFGRVDWLERTDDDALLAAALQPPRGVTVTGGRVQGAGGLLDAPIDPVGEALLSDADGRRSVSSLLAEAADRLGHDRSAVLQAAPGVLRRLVESGALRPPVRPAVGGAGAGRG